MEKLIKLLFPKTYEVIYNKGYSDAYNYLFPEDDYEYPEDYWYEVEPEDYWIDEELEE